MQISKVIDWFMRLHWIQTVIAAILGGSFVSWIFSKAGLTDYNLASTVIICLILGLTFFYAVLNLIILFRFLFKKEPTTYILAQYDDISWQFLSLSNISKNGLQEMRREATVYFDPELKEIVIEDDLEARPNAEEITQGKSDGELVLVVLFDEKIKSPEVDITFSGSRPITFEKRVINLKGTGALLQILKPQVGDYLIRFNKGKINV